MKSLLLLLISISLLLSLRAEKLVVGASAVPHAEILEFVKPRMAELGVELEIKIFTDYLQPNVQLVEKQLDANFFQHRPFLNAFNAGRGTHLVTIVAVHIEPFGVYSRKIKALTDLQPGATIAIPNDPSNSGRALLLLERSGVLKLKPGHRELPTIKDIVGNTKKYVIRELEAAMLPRILDQVDLALINTNYALEAKLDPVNDALAREGPNSPYANFLVARPDNSNPAAIAKLAGALTKPDVKAFIKEKYKGAVVPAF